MKRGNAEAFVSQHAGASQAATGNEDWRKHNRWASLVTLAVPSTAAQLWPSLILLGMVIWLHSLGNTIPLQFDIRNLFVKLGSHSCPKGSKGTTQINKLVLNQPIPQPKPD
ncbi:MAG: hypothetical protein MUD04_08360 [Cyanobium sp. Prado107]|nr:hypothetical protein [Cyanobium sp. Prado107]